MKLMLAAQGEEIQTKLLFRTLFDTRNKYPNKNKNRHISLVPNTGYSGKKIFKTLIPGYESGPSIKINHLQSVVN